ncbi:hypothetical protein ISF_08791 [Cordyceps fumosorosea ARSEF 2679]|uniref:Large ribosomal subunit protein mL67 n=1 Tax=Cordyceps fumosorosea (strain ARSEF 2679) TaxID=1081104 RepID=A0A162K515_CORFA|nr:hypothetical protein ISF_08791 [Cordyceps fumosorosea ARSEF 2679]OAA53438.1 hypothetical protein ISF_08791 [Cordyceps fumosorosea ARSEF 2679]
MNTTQRARVAQLPDIARLCVRQLHGAKRPPNPMAFQGPEGHGENIWVFAHRRTDQIIYSFNSTLDGFHDMKQLPFNGKKTKPAKLRKDYWAPMARIAFPRGAGAVGVAAFQKLRELKHLHEVSWDDTLLYKKPIEYTETEKKAVARRAAEGEAPPLFTRTKAERGKALNAQKTNSIADIAAVLGGAGAGNKIVSRDGKGPSRRVEVKVTWANILDAGHAQKWTRNVSHSEMVDPVPETALPAEAEAAA